MADTLDPPGSGQQAPVPFWKQATEIDITLLQQTVKIRIGAGFVIISAVICTALTIIFSVDPKNAAQAISTIAGGLYDSQGDVEQLLETEFQFTTPSPRTAPFLRGTKNKDCDLTHLEDWYTVDDDKIEAFINDLKNEGIQGYNVWEGEGEGTNCKKPGYIWQVNTRKSSSLDRQKLLLLYSKHFKRDTAIYIRETRLSQTRSTVGIKERVEPVSPPTGPSQAIKPSAADPHPTKEKVETSSIPTGPSPQLGERTSQVPNTD